MIPVGLVLDGDCDGFFGGYVQGSLRVESSGADWIVARDSSGRPHLAVFRNFRHLFDVVERWTSFLPQESHKTPPVVVDIKPQIKTRYPLNRRNKK